jgi:hypothetical protein
VDVFDFCLGVPPRLFLIFITFLGVRHSFFIHFLRVLTLRDPLSVNLFLQDGFGLSDLVVEEKDQIFSDI